MDSPKSSLARIKIKFPDQLWISEIFKKFHDVRMEIEHFLYCAANRKKPLISAEDGKRALEIAVRINRKIRAENAGEKSNGRRKKR